MEFGRLKNFIDGEWKDSQSKDIATLYPGDWVGEIAFVRQIPRTATAIAAEPSVVMAINKKTMDALDENIQLFFFYNTFPCN